MRDFGHSLAAVKNKLDTGVSLKQEISLIEDFILNNDVGSIKKVSDPASRFFNWVSCVLAYAEMVQPRSGKSARSPKN